MDTTKVSSPPVSADRASLIDRILANQAKLFRAGVSAKRLTAEGFLFTDDDTLRKLENMQILTIKKHRIDA
jgi:hypothetical protein